MRDMNDTDTKSSLVTGATGFIGSHLTRSLVQDGWRVTALIRTPTLKQPGFIAPTSVDVAEYDGSQSSVNSAIATAAPSIVFHLASVTPAQTGLDHIETMINANILFGTQLLEAMNLNGCKCLVNTGTFSQHFDGAPYNPSNLYAATKQAFEAIIEYYRQAASLSCMTLKLCDTYGPADPRPKILTFLLRQLKSNEPLATSPGDQKLDLVHVNDVCSAYLKAAELLRRQPSALDRSYSVASGRLLSLKQIVSLVEQLAGRHLKINWGGRSYRPREVMTPWIGPSLPGWQPEISLEAGLKQLIQTALEE
jgi:nucleoside-diphosphate-sugar epimerase